MLNQQPPDGGFEVIVVDGFSTDGTRELLSRLVSEHPLLRLVDNPGKIVSTGLNAGVKAALGEIVVRVDVHTTYATDYVRQCVHVLTETGADNVGGPWHAVGSGYVGTAIAAAFHSRFGSGGALAHNSSYEGPVDTVYLGCWRRDVLERLGGFDEELVRNQDDELNLRIRRSGGTVWQSTRIKSFYSPRGSLFQLFRQYMQYGYWKVRVIQKHRIPAAWRHVVPAAFVVTQAVLVGASVGSHTARWGAAMVALSYISCAAAAAVVTAKATGWRLLPVLPLVFACFHLGYGCGFLRGIWDFAILGRAAANRMSSLTRGATLGKHL
jgi:succinoglycan biosynthesis protein ExoA